MLRFDGRVAIVTGAAKGLGREYCRLLGSRGARLVINCLPQEDGEAEALVAEIRSSGGDAIVVAGDIGGVEVPNALVEAAVSTWGRVDIAVSNAGNTPPASHASNDPSLTIDPWLDVHVRATLRLNAAAWPHMQEHGYGRLLATSSAAATGYINLPDGHLVDYSLAKASLFGVVRQTAAEGRSHGIACNLVMPWAYTTMVREATGGSELGRWMEANLRAELVANAVAPLLHEDCPVSGEAITAGGGRVARVFFAATRGLFERDLTPETALERWPEVMGSVDVNGMLVDAFEQTQPREEAVMNGTLIGGAVPALSIIAEMPLKGSSMSMNSGDGD